MSKVAPYQPLLLRLFHGLSGVLAIAALLTGFWVYNTYDRRFGALPLPRLGDIQGIHGTFGLFFLLVFPGLAVYSFHWGYRRLITADFAPRLTHQIGQPLWWQNLQRLTNTLMLLAGTFSVVSGRMMQEAWLPAGELSHIWYLLHLMAWLVLFLALLLHLSMSFRVGGVPLLLSMVQVQSRPNDPLVLWWQWIRDRSQ